MDQNQPQFAAVIGDILKSRGHSDRAALQKVLLSGLERVNDAVESVHGFHVTIGDEFQGLFSSLGTALSAALRLRIWLHTKGIEVRFGIGCGAVPVRDAGKAPFAQDGPGWWHARSAIERVKKVERKNEWPRNWRTAMESDDPERDKLINAFLMCRDGLLDRMDKKDLVLIAGAFEGEASTSLAGKLEISESAISQRQQGHGIYAVLRAHEQLADLVA